MALGDDAAEASEGKLLGVQAAEIVPINPVIIGFVSRLFGGTYFVACICALGSTTTTMGLGVGSSSRLIGERRLGGTYLDAILYMDGCVVYRCMYTELLAHSRFNFFRPVRILNCHSHNLLKVKYARNLFTKCARVGGKRAFIMRVGLNKIRHSKFEGTVPSSSQYIQNAQI